MKTICPSCRSENSADNSFSSKCGSRLSGSDGRLSPTSSIDVEGKLLKPGSLFAGKYKIEGEIGRGLKL